MKIQEIQINDYRSFVGKNSIMLDKSGKNLFLYGENGSGKSSFCRALNLFFDASDKRRISSLISQNLINSPFENVEREINSSIDIHFNNNVKCTLDKDGFSNEAIIDSLSQIRRMKGFLEYKNLLPIYLYSDKKNNLFRLFVEGPFSTLRNPLTNKLISTEWNDRKKTKLSTDFFKGIFSLAESLEDKINVILKYFDPNLEIKFKSKKTWTTGVLYIEVFIQKTKLNNYGDYFNEAKLVALAISIYLAIILKQGNEVEKESEENLKLIILDDIFIGMDLGNRIPLLKILNDLFSSYQVVITTFDENWYNVAEFYLERKKWKFIKAYSDNLNPTKIRSELMDSLKEDYYYKAKFYYKRFDYPACANYQRKTIEKKIKEILPDNLLTFASEDGSIKRNDKLNTNYENLIKYLKASELDTTPFEDFKLYSKTILNPLSHDNASSPVYKREVEALFDIIDSLNNIEIRLLKKVNENGSQILKLSVQDDNEIWHQYKVELVDNLKQIKQGVKIGYAPCRVIVKSTKTDKEEWIDVESDKPECLKLKYESIIAKHNGVATHYSEAYKNNKNVAIKDM